MTKLLDILGCKYPIIQGPIGQLNDPKMAMRTIINPNWKNFWFPVRILARNTT